MDDDANLLQLYHRERSEKAFATLVERHLRSIYAVVLRRVGGDTHLAEEATQDVFTALSRKAGSLVSKPSLAGWLFVSARFAAAKLVRGERRKRELLLKEELLHETLSKQTNDSELRPILDSLIQNLNTADREVVVLRFYEDRSFAEIGLLLRLPENTARMRVTRAVEKLRQKLLRQGIASTSAALLVGLASQASGAVPVSLSGSVVASAIATPLLTTASVFSLMALTKSKTIVLGALLASGAVFVGFEQQRKISTLRATLDTEESSLRDVQNQLRLASDQLQSSEKTRKFSMAKSDSSAAQNFSKKEASPDATIIHIHDLMRERPEFAEIEHRVRRTNALFRYNSAIQLLHLDPSIEKKLKNLIVERDAEQLDAQEAASDMGAKFSSPEWAKLSQDAIKPLDREIKALIGNAAYEKMENLESADISTVTRALSGQSDSFTTDQTNQLRQAYYEANSQTQNSAAKSDSYREPDHTSWLSSADVNFLNKAAAILPPEQIEIAKSAIADNNHYNAIIGSYNKNHNSATVILP